MDKFVVFLLCFCLTIGGIVHLYDNIIDAQLPYDLAPQWLNIYWRCLGVLYLLTVFLLNQNRRIGLVFMLVILFTNVTINSHAQFTLDILNNHTELLMTTLFLGFAIGVSMWLWNSPQSRQSRLIFR